MPSASEAQQLKIARLIQQPSKPETTATTTHTDVAPVHKKRKVKGANPLSMKKKKKQAPPPPKKKSSSVKAGSAAKAGEKRKRPSDDTKDS